LDDGKLVWKVWASGDGGRKIGETKKREELFTNIGHRKDQIKSKEMSWAL
jgi:hypothetical protein